MIERIRYAIARRPVRVVEAALLLAAALGFALEPELQEHIVALVVAVVGIAGGEVAQTKTTSYRYPMFKDGHGDQGDG